MKKFKDIARSVFQATTAGSRLQGNAVFRGGAICLAVAYLGYVSFFLGLSAEAGTAQVPEVPEPMPELSEGVNDVASVDFLQMADWHLFGRASDNDQIGTVSQTQLQLKLLGVFLVSKTPESAYAIIQAEDGVQKKFRQGEALPGGAMLKTIEISKVVLLHDNRQELLLLQRSGADSKAITE